MDMKRLLIAALPILFFVEASCQSKSTDAGQSGASFQNISAEEFKTKATDPNVVIIDVRTKGEVADGYIKGATVFADVNSDDFQKTIANLDKTKTYLVYCRSGARSAKASDALVNQGFNQVFNLSGGILGWTGEVVK